MGAAPTGIPVIPMEDSLHVYGSHRYYLLLPEAGVKDFISAFFVEIKKEKLLEILQARAVVIPTIPDWMIRATAMMTPAISSATATLPFLSSSNSWTPVVSLSRMFKAR